MLRLFALGVFMYKIVVIHISGRNIPALRQKASMNKLISANLYFEGMISSITHHISYSLEQLGHRPLKLNHSFVIIQPDNE